MAALTSPAKHVLAMDGVDKHCVQHMRDLVTISNKEKMRELFARIDADKSGELDEDDFKHENARFDNILKEVWRIIRVNFDFNDDKSISSQEFFDGFILHAWLAPSDLLQPLEPQPTVGLEFRNTIERFNHALRIKISELEDVVDGKTETRSEAMEAEVIQQGVFMQGGLHPLEAAAKRPNNRAFN